MENIRKKIRQYLFEVAVKSELNHLRPELASAAQSVYDEWEQDEDGNDEMLGGGGICQDIAEKFC